MLPWPEPHFLEGSPESRALPMSGRVPIPQLPRPGVVHGLHWGKAGGESSSSRVLGFQSNSGSAT